LATSQKRDACNALLADAQAAVGKVTHFVHGASPARREADHAFAVSRQTWQQMHAVNLDAGFHLARELARPLIAADEPRSFLFLISLHAGTPRNLPHHSGIMEQTPPGSENDPGIGKPHAFKGRRS
jgi:3-oxoacyl-[acyl-carrier protein] reductase